MHETSLKAMKIFVDTFVRGEGINILDVGSKDEDPGSEWGNYRKLFDKPGWNYVGCDISSGHNVDVILTEPYKWDFRNEEFDYVISGQAFEHIQYPWLTIKEIYRVLKPNGMVCIIAPAKEIEHKYPWDCYRYYPQGMEALAVWGGLKPIYASLGPDTDFAQDCVLMAVKNED